MTFTKLLILLLLVALPVQSSAAYRKLIRNADIAAGAAIAVNKLQALTASRACTLDASGFPSASSVTSAELGFLSGVTSSVQTQLGTKAPTATPTFTGVSTFAAGSAAAPSVAFTGALTSGLFGITNGLAWTTNGTERFRIDSSGITTWGSSTSGGAQFNIVNQGDVSTGGFRLSNSTAGVAGNWDFWAQSGNNLMVVNTNRGVRYMFGSGGGFAVGGNGTAAQAGLELRGAEVSTLDSSIALINGNVRSNTISATNTDTTNGNKSAMIFGTDNTNWDAGIIGTHDTHGASYAGHMDFWVSTGGTLSKAMTLATNKQPTFPFFSTAGPVIASASGALTSPGWAATILAGSGITRTDNGDGTVTISASGTPAANRLTKTADYTLTSTDNVILANCSTACTQTLESAAVAGSGATHTIKRIGSATVSIATTSSQTIDGDTSAALTDPYVSITVISDGSNWYAL